MVAPLHLRFKEVEMDSITFSQAIEGYSLAAHARRLSRRTLADYSNTYRKLHRHLGDLPIAIITVVQIRDFMAAQPHLSKKTLLNYHTGLSALWKWAVDEELVPSNIMREVQRPKPEKRVIHPYSEDDVRAMIKAAERSRSYQRPGQRQAWNKLATASRNKAIILILVDTGVRAEELCKARIGDLDLRNRKLKVMGKGDKERILQISPSTGQAVWRYLATRPKEDKPPGRPLFVNTFGRQIGRDDLYHVIQRIGDRAGVGKANVHGFRHTFAIQFLRNQANPWALQMALGHSTMDMVRRYLALAQADMEATHRLASPVANWGL
jgi:integrase